VSTQELYNQWSATYDTVENKTRDLEKIACQQILADIPADSIIELGCGTGKNTEWLADKATHLSCIDLSEDMMAKAKEKIKSGTVIFQQADITQPWNFTERKADLITCSLILEHIEDLDFIFQQAKEHLKENGHFYLCELHPFKQYTGSKARFEMETGTQVLQCYTHHISDYLKAAERNELRLVQLNEWFDKNDVTTVPRLISFLFKRVTA
jgi:ubiquinone/menaquinone biosynthesis C-methylase UbiE